MSDAATGLDGPSAAGEFPVPIRVGAWVELVDGHLVGHLPVHPAIVRHGVLEPTAYAAVVDMLGGLAVDTDRDSWVFTSIMSVRTPPGPAPDVLRCTVDILRAGARSSTSEIRLCTADGVDLGVGFTGFSRVARRETDPPKPDFDLATVGDTWSSIPVLDRPVRDAAGLRVVDPRAGHVELDVVPLVSNPAGALHGAMVALAVTAAAEELSDVTLGGAHVAGDFDLRYLAQARVGPVRTRARFVGDPAVRSLVVDLVDAGRDELLLATATVRTYDVS